jgi:hypothetical protein
MLRVHAQQSASFAFTEANAAHARCQITNCGEWQFGIAIEGVVA